MNQKLKTILITVALVLSFAIPAFADPILGGVMVYTVQCNGTAKTLSPTNATVAQTEKNRAIVSYRWWVNSATPVFVGGTNVAATVTGMPYCTDTASCVLPTDTIDSTPVAMSCKTGGTNVDVIILAGFR